MIEITGLTMRYGSHTVLDDIDLRVDQGRITAVVGPSGAGKSTLARCINLLERPTAGSVRVGGAELARLSRGELRVARRRIGTVFQSASLLRRLTAGQNVALPLRFLGLSEAEQRQRVGELLERVGLLHRANHYPAQLSGGQRQRIGIARALALRPSVLLCDEATSGLDPATTSSILRLLTELRAELGVTTVVITHEMDVVRQVADHVVRLDGGRIVEAGAIGEVLRRPDSPLADALLAEPPAGGRPGPRSQMWRLHYRQADVDPHWPGLAGRELGGDIAILSALVEQVAGEQAGRLTVGLPDGTDDEKARTVFWALGIHAVPVLVPEPDPLPAPGGDSVAALAGRR